MAHKDRKPFHEEFAAQLIEDLKKGTAPWQKPWLSGELHAPLNPVSGTVYSGINRVMLSRKGYEDPRWMSLKQANSLDCRVRKGEKAQTIVYWQFSKEEPARDDDGKPKLDGEGNQVMEKVELSRPIVRFSSVFHVSQLEGNIPPLDPSTVSLAWDPNQKAETILENSGATIKHNQRNRAYYSLRSDEICLPPKDHFPSADGYYVTALHELGHWTGHPSRMDREFGPFGSEPYAREELRAEIASWMLGQDLGIGHDPGQHLAYVDSWVSVLEKDPYEIVRACRDAEKIKQHVLNMEQKQEQSQEMMAQNKAVASSPAEKKEDLDARVHFWHENETGKSLQDFLGLSDDAFAAYLRDEGVEKAPPAPAKEKTFLAVPFREKERAKVAGAKWDGKAKLWYAPEGADMTKLGTWLSSKEPSPAQTMDPKEEFAQALRAAGLELQGAPIMDGKIHRVPIAGRPNALDGAYKGFLDGHPAGWYQNYVTGEKTTWKAHGHTLTDEQKAALKLEAAERGQRRERERLARQDEVASQCRQAFEALPPIRPIAELDHPYLLRKGVPPLGGIKESSDGKLLLVPLYNAQGELRNVQEIDWDGNKRFQKDGQKSGCFFKLDFDDKHSTNEIILTEGYATGVSVNVATNKPVAVAFDAGNLEPVAKSLREMFPEAKITICADNDHSREHGNIGIEKATQAAQAIGGEVVIPVFNKEERAAGLTDFNDLQLSRGLAEVAGQVFKGKGVGRAHDQHLGRELSCEMTR